MKCISKLISGFILMTLILCTASIELVHAYSVLETGDGWLLENESIKAYILGENGNIEWIKRKVDGVSVLAEPAYAVVSFPIHRLTYDTKDSIIDSSSIEENQEQIILTLNQGFSSVDFSVMTEYVVSDTEFSWYVKVQTQNDVAREVQIQHRIPVDLGFDHFFTPQEPSIHSFPESDRRFKQRSFRYRSPDGSGIVLPAVTVFRYKDDLGISFIQPFDMSKPTSYFRINVDNIDRMIGVSIENLRLSSSRTASSGVHLVVHEGDWRPGLGWMLDKYPEYFRPGNPEVYRWEGNMMIGSPDTVVKMQKYTDIDLVGMGLRWVEVPTSNDVLGPEGPYYGRYIPNDPAVSERWNKWAKEAADAHGVGSMMYLQTYEMWDKVALDRFADAIAKDENGKPYPAFEGWGKQYSLMNPDPKYSWYEYILDQGKQLIQLTPENAGIFWDRCDYPWFDFVHDDGISMVYGREAYMLAFGLESIMKDIRNIANKHNKVIWSNFPYYIEIGKYYDGVMAENRWDWMMTLQYVSIARPLVMLNYWNSGDIYSREKDLKYALVAGAFTSTQGLLAGPRALGYDIHMKYVPLIQLFKEKEWVLDAHALSLPDGNRGNIFTTPEHDYIVSIVDLDTSYFDDQNQGEEVQVRVRVKDDFEIGNIYTLSVDYEGRHEVVYEQDGQYLYVTIPNHKSASMLIVDRVEQQI